MRTVEGTEEAILAALGSAGEGDLRRVDVALGYRALRVPGPHLHVCLRVHGRLVRDRRVPEPVEGSERFDDLRLRQGGP
jgi:hypothetical protein